MPEIPESVAHEAVDTDTEKNKRAFTDTQNTVVLNANINTSINKY